MLDLVVRHAPDLDEEGLIHLYAGFVFALAGSIGFALGWALLLTLRHDKQDREPAHLVREALRLYPVAWHLERYARAEQEILGERVTPADTIVVSPYAIHRSPLYWEEPYAFRPERWQGSLVRHAWLPFGVGGHSCVAASLSLDLAAALLRTILAAPCALEGGDGPPSIGAALAPPAFRLRRA
jgi:cytochrome P450